MLARTHRAPTLFQAAQIRANNLAQGSGLGKEGMETRVAGLLTVSDATYGEKNMPWHGSCGKSTTQGTPSSCIVISCNYIIITHGRIDYMILQRITCALHAHYMP